MTRTITPAKAGGRASVPNLARDAIIIGLMLDGRERTIGDMATATGYTESECRKSVYPMLAKGEFTSTPMHGLAIYQISTAN